MKQKLLKILAALAIALNAVSPLVSMQSVNAEPSDRAAEQEPEMDGSETNDQIIIVEGEIDVKSLQEVQEDKHHVLISVDASSDEEGIEIHGIRAPDGSYTEGATAEYLAPCNGTYEFEVIYRKDGEEKSQLYYEYVFGSDRMEDGNPASKANGWMVAENPETFAFGDQPSGSINTKLFPYSVTVDGQKMGPGNLHYVAYMQDNDANAVLCIEPEETAGTVFEQYQVKEKNSRTDIIYGKDRLQVEYEFLARIWFYSQIQGIKESGLSLSLDEWTFVTQLMIWEALGYSVSGYDSRFQRAMDWVDQQIGKHETYQVVNESADPMLEVWVNEPWPEGTETLDADRYVSKDGKINTNGAWTAFDPKTTVLSFGDPKYVWGGYEIQTEEQEIDGNKVTVIKNIIGGSISVRNRQEIGKEYYPLYSRSSKKVSIEYGNSEGFIRYDFTRNGNLEGTESVLMSYQQEQDTGTSYEYQSSVLQDILCFKMPDDDLIMFSLPFSEEPNAEVPEQPQKPVKKDLKAPGLLKVDMDDGFPVQGAEFTFHAGESYKLHYVWTKEIEVWRCTGSGDDEVCGWEDGGTSEGKKSETVWSQGDEVMDSETTPSDGRIDTSPIIDNYYDAYDALWTEIQEEYAEKSTNESSDTRNVTYTVELDPEYTDKEGEGWVGGRFYAQEPHTSQNTCNDDSAGEGACKPDYDGYLNLSPWEKIPFEISEKVSEDAEIVHRNERQRGRFTVHKVDGEEAYLNHNNSHEAQGDGYFYGSVFVVTAREDIVLHDGSIPDSQFTGNPLKKGEVADVLVLQLPMKDDGTYDYEYIDNLSSSTTRMLELGEYAVQEVRWPGVYKEDIPLIYDEEDKLWHVDPAQADDVLAKLKDKDSEYYQFDYEKAKELYENDILPIDSPDGGYWFKDYVNGIANTTNAGFIGGQMINVDIEYVGEDKAYNEVIPGHDRKPGNVIVNGEEATQMIPEENYVMSRGEPYHFTVNAGLDYGNSIQKGHIQLKKILTEAPGIDGSNDNTGVDSDLNIAGKDIYFAIYLDRKTGSLIQDSTKDYELVDKYFASERLDGLKYVYDVVGNFELYAEDEPTSSVTGYHKASEEEIKNGLGLVMVSVDGTTTNMKPADNYCKWEMREISDDITASIKVNTYFNPYYNNIALNDQNLSDKELYMILKTDNQGLAGTNMPHTIVWANYAALDNTGNANNYGEWSYNTGSLYSKEHAEVLDYLHKNGLPLPYGSYTIVELNAPQGYEGVSWKAQVSKNLTTYDINEESTVWELGIEKSTERYLSDNEDPQGWTSQQASVDGDGHAEDQTWLNKQFHIFSDYVSTSRYVGQNIEDKLHRQILEIVKIDKETGKTIAYDSASFRVFQWNPMLDLNNDWKHAEYADGEWKVTYQVPEYDAQGNIVSVTTYQETDFFTDSKGINRQLGQWIRIPANGTGIYTTDSEGRAALSQPLPPADYFLLEVKAPEGYLLHTQPIPFSIEAIGGTTEPNEGDSIAVPVVGEDGNFVCKENKDCNNPDSPDYALDENGEVVLENCEWQAVPQYVTIAIAAEDMPQKGYVEIEKKGSIFDKFVQYVTDFAEMIGFKPTWKEDQTVKLNTTFCIYAREDIVVNGEVKFEKDECIQKMDTTDEGHAFSEALYLGKYYVKECDAPHGYITSGEEMDFELSYDDQKVIVHPDFKEFQNDRQKFSIHLNKSDEEGNPLEGAVFGIFAGEDLPKGIQHEEEPEKTGNETLSMDEMDVSLNGEWQNVCNETETGIVCDSTFVGEKTAILNAVSTDKERFIVPSRVTIDGEEVPLVTIGAYAFMNCDAKAITLPETITTVKDYAFALNDELEYLQFLGETAPSFAGNVFPTGHELLGIYIPWHALSSYDLAIVDGMADNNGSKDQRLMGIPLKDDNLIWNEDEEFTQNPFDTEGYSNFGKVEDTVWTLEEAEDYGFALEKKTKSIDGDAFAGYFITGYAGDSKEIFVPEKIIDDDYDAEGGGKMVPVVGIDAQAFYQLDADTILIPDTIRYIGNEAFADNEDLSMIRFYETEYREFEDESGNGSLDIEDDMQLDTEAELCGTNGGTWTEQEDGSFACEYIVATEKETSEEECTSLGGTYTEGICSYDRETTGEMPEPDIDAGMSVAEMIVGRRLLLVGIGGGADVATPSDTDKSNSQIACEANGGAWNSQTGTCSGGNTEVEETLDGGFDIGYRPSNSQTACEAKGGTWNDALGTCSLEYEPDWDETPVYVSESAFDFTPSLTWIVAGEFNWYRFDTAYIVDSNGDVLVQDGDRDGSLWWNPEALNPQTGKQGYWELGEDKPALLGYPIVLNHLTDDEDPIDPGMSFPNEELPNETTGIKEGTLIEVVRTDAEGRAVTQFDYPEGRYYVKELKAPEGYLTSNEKYFVELKYQDMNDEPVIDVYANNGEAIINYKKENHPLRVEILKVDGNNMKPLAGAEFQLWDHERTTVLETLVTDADGKAVTKGLYDANEYSGYLWLKETKAPDGYEIIGDGWFRVDIDETADGITTKIVVENYRPEEPEEPYEPGNPSYDSLRVRLLKEMEGNLEDAWKDVVFGIFAAEDIYTGRSNPRLVYSKDEMLTSGHIDENGIFNVLLSEREFKLADGSYYVQEIRTNDDYVLDGTKWYFDYDRERDGSHAVVRINDMKPIVNYQKEIQKTTIRVEKVDKQDQSKKLKGAEFVLVKDGTDINKDGIVDEKDAVDIQVSGDDGYAYFKDVEPGIYWIKETDAPEGYVISPYWRKAVVYSDRVEVSEQTDSTASETEVLPIEDDTVTIVWTNAPRQVEEGTGINEHLGFVQASAVLSLAGMTFLIVLRKRFIKEN